MSEGEALRRARCRFTRSLLGGVVVQEEESPVWRTKQRQRTVGAALVLCLNIGVDPPDIIKTDPCARLECWIDPFSLPPKKALATIGKRLQLQYERWQPRARYKPFLDRTDEDLKKMCLQLRRSAKTERVLFHYNGHGVPRPTQNGEIWVFNKNYTQYIPVSLYDLHSWLSSPTMYIFDSSSSGLLIQVLEKILSLSMERKSNVIALASCSATQILPMNPDFPADIFTSCLTTPVRMALKWFLQKSILSSVSAEDVDQFPGTPNDRRSPFGSLNWIFIAITDTIAWSILSKDVFQRLFRQDLLVASLFRNFLLAERIMRSLNCTPTSIPVLPSALQHPLWDAWDCTTEFYLSQLEKTMADPAHDFDLGTFFQDQLTAFEVWLDFTHTEEKPLQLPIVLQVLLSQAHRLRALHLLSRFVDKGVWAVHQALAVGIFPYILKLLQSPTVELRDVLVFIWAKILAVDQSCREDLIREQYHRYFIKHLSSDLMDRPIQSRLICFILATFCDNYSQGKYVVLQAGACVLFRQYLQSPESTTRVWVILATAKLWEEFDDAQLDAQDEGLLQELCHALTDPVPEVRAAAVFAIGRFFHAGGNKEESAQDKMKEDVKLAHDMCMVVFDGSPMVRHELISSLYSIFGSHTDLFHEGKHNVNDTLWSQRKDIIAVILALRQDPFPSVSMMANDLARLCHFHPTASNGAHSDDEVHMDSKRPYSMRRTISLASSLHKAATTGKKKRIRKSSSSPRFQTHGQSQFFKRSSLYEWQRSLMNNPILGAVASRGEDLSLLVDDVAQTMEDVSLGDTSLISMDRLASQLWEKEYRASITAAAVGLTSTTDIPPLSSQKCTITTNFESIRQLAFHPYDSTVCAVGPTHTVGVWSAIDGHSMNLFDNQTKLLEDSKSTITDVKCMPCEDGALMAIASDDGIIRVWSDAATREKQQLRAAWVSVPGQHVGKLQIDWNEAHHSIFSMGSNEAKVFVWDARSETTRSLLLDESGSRCCTSFCTASIEPVLLWGQSDGEALTMDWRAPPGSAQMLAKHSSPVMRVAVQESGHRVVSAGSRGDILVHDLRFTSTPYTQFDARDISPLTAFAMHSFAPLIAIGSSKQHVKLFDFEGKLINKIRHYDGFLGQRIGPVTCLEFHKHRLLLAVGGQDANVSLYSVQSA